MSLIAWCIDLLGCASFWRGPYPSRLSATLAKRLSDILTEIDGIPGKGWSSLLANWTDKSLFVPSKTGDEVHAWDDWEDGKYFENHMWLRCHLNQTLHLLYGPNKAYAQPHELGDIVCSLSADLDRWYQGRPLNERFVRDITTLDMYVPLINHRLVSKSSNIPYELP